MKHVVLAMFVLIASMRVQASSCDMHDEMPAGAMTSHAHHAGMDMDMDEQPAMDCCDDSQDAMSGNCESSMDCGACAGSMSALHSVSSPFLPRAKARLQAQVDGPTNSKSHSPPLRPPIA